MKTKFLFAALAAAAMTACSTDEVVDVNRGNAISFRTSIDRAVTRTTVYSSTSLMDNFKVTAIGNSATYFDGLEVTKGEDNAWTTASTYYWPNYNLDFYAYAPTDINSTSSATVSIASGDNAQTISNFKPTSKVANQQDLVVAVAKDQASSSSAVALNFKHALSQIDVKALCTRTDVQVKVLGVKLVNVANTGTFTFPTATTSNDATINSQWAAGDATASYMSGVSTAVTLTKGETTTAQSIMASDDHFLMIPQTLTAGSVSGSSITGAYISVLCQILVKQGNESEYKAFFPSTSDASKYAFAAVPLSGTWEAGKKYTYTLSFGGSDGTGGCGYVDPTQSIPDGSSYSVPSGSTLDSSASGSAGNKILGNAISFSVTVDDWTDGTVTEPTL